MTVVQAIVLGVCQGLGEFLPISSSAHLVLIPWVLGWPDPGLTFDIALHWGTLISVIVFFWRDWLKLLQGGLKGFATVDGRLFWFLVAATIPGAAIGFLLEHAAETAFRAPALIAVMLMSMGVVLLLADKKGSKTAGLEQVTLAKSLLIGFSQALAIIPGVSRSGITMTAGLFAGLQRETAARFSFLLSAPIILGAGILKVPKIFAQSGAIDAPFLIGILVSAVSGFLSIKVMLTYIQTHDFRPFVWYRLAIGMAVLALACFR